MNKAPKIETSSFGLIVIDGKQYTSDLMIFPDGRVKDGWWRKSGHGLEMDDIRDLLASSPEVLVVGTGVNGLMKPAAGLAEALAENGTELIPLPNEAAVALFNELAPGKKVAACFHLTC